MEVLRLEVKLELQLWLAYATTTAKRDLSCILKLCLRLWQHWILNPLTLARDLTCILMDASWVLNLLSHSWNSNSGFFKPTALDQELNPCLHSNLGCCSQSLIPLCHRRNSQIFLFLEIQVSIWNHLLST